MSPAHPKEFSTHEQNRNKVCLICSKKIKLPKKKSLLTPQDVNRIKLFLKPDFDQNNEKFPNALCGSCRCKLTRKSKTPDLNLPSLKDYDSVIKITPGTRSNLPCSCLICEIGREKNVFKKSITNTNALICTLCIGVVKKGIKHSCSESNAPNNVISLMSNLTDKTKSQVASKLIDLFPKEDKVITLSTKGRFRKIALNPKPEASTMFMAENFTNLKTQLNLSHNSINQVAKMIRSVQGKFNES